MPFSSITRWKPRFVIDVTATVLDAEREREDRDDLIAVDGRARLVDGEHPVAVPVEGDSEVEAAVADDLGERAQVGRAATDVDVRPVGRVADRRHVGAELLEGLRREAGVRAVRAVDRDAETAEIGAEPLEDVLEVAVRRDVDAVDLATAARRLVEERLDLLLGGVAELASPCGRRTSRRCTRAGCGRP